MTTMTSEIDVDVDPMTAFTIFTDEFDQWWGDGPIDAYKSWRLVERRIEPGVGGRIVESYEDDELVTGHITVWQPGARLSWTNPRNDTTIDVTFEPITGGTRVRVDGTVTGTNLDGMSMVRMAPQWLPRYIARRSADDKRADLGRLHIGLRYTTPAATARWLADAFQLEPKGDLPMEDGDPSYTWIELRVGNGFIAIWGAADGPIGTDHSPFVYVDDLDAHLAHAEAAGAKILSPITEHGFRSYTAADCEGRLWLFAQAGPRLGR